LAVVAQGAAALAVSMGIGRFVYTPILPLMVREAGLSKSFGATLATANYAGYLLGALAGIVAPALVRKAGVMRGALLASVATLALMPVTHDHAAWFVLRFVAGGASALVFMFAVSAMLSHLRHGPPPGRLGVRRGRCRHRAVRRAGIDHRLDFDVVGGVVVFGACRASSFGNRVGTYTTRAGREGDGVTESRRRSAPRSLVHGAVRRLLA